jgi:hypothetical protein
LTNRDSSNTEKTLGHAEKTLSYTEKTLGHTEKTLGYIQNEKRNKILDWLSKDDFNLRHVALQEARLKNTGQWFVNSDEFTRLINGTHSCLLCEGVGTRP